MTAQAFNLSYWVTQCLAMGLAALLIPNLRVTSIVGPVLAVVGLALVNTYVWSSDLFFTIPQDVSSQTATLLLINGAIFWLVVKLTPGIETKGILPSLVAPLVFTVCSVMLPRLIPLVDWSKARAQAEQVLVEAKRFVQSHEEEKPAVH